MCGARRLPTFGRMANALLDLTRAAHITAGGVALVTLWIPLLAAKGARLHRRAGWIYTWAMAVVALSGAGLAAVAFATGHRPRSAFLGYVALLTASNTWLGIRALSRSASPVARAVDFAFPAALAAASLVLGVYGAAMRSVLFVGFAILGAVLGASQLVEWLGTAPRRQGRVLRHMTGMGGSCIATLTAFLVVNAGRVGLGGSVLPWFLPGIGGTIVIVVWRRRLERAGTHGLARTR